MDGRERSARVQFLAAILRAIEGAVNVLTSDEVGKSFDIYRTELSRQLSIYEAEVNQDIYRSDVQKALADRIASRKERESRLDESANARMQNIAQE